MHYHMKGHVSSSCRGSHTGLKDIIGRKLGEKMTSQAAWVLS